jgi:hypothetical protein
MKRFSAWLKWGSIILCLLGLGGLGMGLLLPGSYHPSEITPTSGKSAFVELEKKSDAASKQLREMLEQANLGEVNTLTHRVFVSRTLLFLPKEKESVQPLNENLVTPDGINVSWKIQNGFDIQDPNVAQQDDDNDGFSNKEEFEKGTDPNNPASSPSKWIKIKIASVETNSLGIEFSGKSGEGRFTLRFLSSGKKKDVDVTLGDKLWVAVTAKGPEILKSEAEAKKIVEGGACPHAIPIVVKSYHQETGDRLDDKTKTPIAYDDSYLDLERLDGDKQLFKVLIQYSYNQGILYGREKRGVLWSVGDIRLISLVPGEGEMGPYRVGQSFIYAGKEFMILEGTPSKVTLIMKPEGEEVQILPKTP